MPRGFTKSNGDDRRYLSFNPDLGRSRLGILWRYYRRTILVVIWVLFMLTCTFGYTYAKAHYDEREVVITVKKAERVYDKSTSMYLVFTQDGDVYCVTDSMWRWSFDASDRYAKIEPGHTYRCTRVGWRWRFTSDYPNLLTVEPE